MANNNSKEKVILLVYSEGGHRSEMDKLVTHLEKKNKTYNNKYVSIYEKGDCLECSDVNYELPVLRDKYSNFQTFVNLMVNPIKIIIKLIEIKYKYDVRIILSTGAGISILPVIFFKFFKTKTIHIESDCRFNSKSLSGRILLLLVDKFYVPNKSLLKLYKKSLYCGQL